MTDPVANSRLFWPGLLRQRVRSARYHLRDYLWRVGVPVQSSAEARTFREFKAARARMCPGDLGRLRVPCKAGRVSVVLPVFNGERYLREAIDSVLGQSFRDFELVAVDDGSTDGSPEILNMYAGVDSRVRVIRQANRGLPHALSNGFRASEGEFLTWMSDDNRLHPEFLAKMVDCLQKHPDWDAAYSNETLIGESGERLTHHDRYPLYQWPYGSGQVRFPSDPSRLNTSGENYVGAAFMYRSRVLHLIEDYSPWRFGLEDYDYWMRVNALMTLRHVDFADCLYDYRYHGKSLTSRHEELAIEPKRQRLLRFDELRREFCLRPLAWCIETQESTEAATSLLEDLSRTVIFRGHVLLDRNALIGHTAARSCPPVVHVRLQPPDEPVATPRADLPGSAMTVLICVGEPGGGHVPGEWDWCIAWCPGWRPARRDSVLQGWVATADLDALVSAIDIRARSHHLARLEAEVESVAACPTAAAVTAAPEGSRL